MNEEINTPMMPLDLDNFAENCGRPERAEELKYLFAPKYKFSSE